MVTVTAATLRHPLHTVAHGQHFERHGALTGVFEHQHDIQRLTGHVGLFQLHEHQVQATGLQFQHGPGLDHQRVFNRAHYHDIVLHDHGVDFGHPRMIGAHRQQPVGHLAVVHDGQIAAADARIGGGFAAPAVFEHEAVHALGMRGDRKHEETGNRQARKGR